MSVTVLLFASVAEKVGLRRLELSSAPGETVGDVRDRLVCAYPALEPFVPNLLYALNEEYVKPDALVADGATLALIPPVSGG
jgi:molybdopterin converting factor subunit 1